MTPTAKELIEILSLERHPGACRGWFRQTWADPLNVNVGSRSQDRGQISDQGTEGQPDFQGTERIASTAIYFLQKAGQSSPFQRQRKAEVFHHYLGSPLLISWIEPKGQLVTKVLGKDFH